MLKPHLCGRLFEQQFFSIQLSQKLGIAIAMQPQFKPAIELGDDLCDHTGLASPASMAPLVH
jgi:hypothetical protein